MKADTQFHRAYASAFEEYLVGRGESALRAAYELGREAVREQLSVLELASMHHLVLASALSRRAGTGEIENVTRAATEFFLESLSAFEMVQRGFWEATQTARLERGHAGQLRHLAEASLAINSVLSLEGILQALADRSRSVIGARCAVATVSGNERNLPTVEAVSSSDATGWLQVAKQAGLLAKAWLGGPIRAARVTGQELERVPGWRALAGEVPRSVRGLLLAVLVGREDRTLGHILVFDKDDGDFSEKDEAILAQLANVASVAIENAQLFEREHQVAETLQRRLLPERLPEIPGVVLAARYMPGAVGIEVGGDWYDVIPLREDRIGIAVGDVLGRGAGAASLMGQVRTAFHAYALSGEPPEVVADRMDHLIQAMELGHFSTMIYGVLEPRRDLIRLVRAGHPPPLVIAPHGEARYVEGGHGLPLGVGEGPKYQSGAECLEPGSVIVLYTDGLVEPVEGLEQGFAQLKDCVERGPAELEALCDHVLEEMVGPTANDDVALLMIRLDPNHQASGGEAPGGTRSPA